MANGADLKLKILINGDAKNAKNAVNEAENSIKSLGQKANETKNYLAGLFGVAVGGYFTDKLIEAVRVIQDLRLRLSGLTTSQQDYAASESYLVDLAERHHKSVNELTKSYSSFLALEQTGVITRQQSIQLLEGFSNAAAKTGASQDQMGQATYGLAQALSTGIVAMEEFKQITEPMPGLAGEIAKAFGMTVGELRVLIGTGTVASEEFGNKFVIALKAYEGAAERAGGTISATYSDIGNAYTAMAKELEKPVATGAVGVVNVGKEAYGWIKDNSAEIINSITAIAVLYAGKSVASLQAYSATKLQAIRVERAHGLEIIKNTEQTLAQIVIRKSAINVDLADAMAKRQLTAQELASASAEEIATRGTTAHGNAVYRLTIAIQEHALVQREVTALGVQNTAVLAEQTAATATLTSATAAYGGGMAAVARAGKAAFALIGGWVGVAVIALYGLYKGLEQVTGSEEKAAIKAKLFSDAIAKANDEIKKMSLQELKIDTKKTEQDITAVKNKISDLEKFNAKNILNLGDTAAQRANLLQYLEVLKERKKQLVAGENEKLINFDASKLSAEELTKEFEATKKQIASLADSIEPLNAKLKEGKLSVYQQDALKQDELRLNAITAKLANISNDPRIKNKVEIVSKTAAADAKKQADLVEKIQKEQRDRDIQNLRDAEAEKIRLIQNSGKTQKQIDDAVFAEKIRTYQLIYNELKNQLAQEKTALDDHANKKKTLSQDELLAKKATLKEIQTAYKTNIDALTQLEQQHRDKVISLDKEIRDLKKQGQDGLREISRAGMTDVQVAEDKKLEIEQKTAQMRQLLNNKQYTEAAELGKELQSLTLEQAKADQAAGKNGADNYWERVRSQDAYKTSLSLTTQALEEQKKQEQDKADKAKFEAEMQKQAMIDLGKQIGALNDTLTKGGELKVVVDTTQVDVLQQKVDEATKPRVIEISWSDKGGMPSPPQQRNKGGFINAIKHFAFGGHVPGSGNGDTVPAMLTPGEFVVTKKAAQKLGSGFLNSLNSGDIIKQHFANGGFVSPSVLQAASLGEKLAESSQRRDSVSETIAVDLSMNGAKATGTFKKDDATKAMLEALTRAAKVGSR